MKRALRILRWLALAVVAFVVLLAVEALIAIQTVPDDNYLRAVLRRRGRSARAASRCASSSWATAPRPAAGRPTERGIAVAASTISGAARRVILRNLAVSGARFGNLRREQLTAAAYRGARRADRRRLPTT